MQEAASIATAARRALRTLDDEELQRQLRAMCTLLAIQGQEGRRALLAAEAHATVVRAVALRRCLVPALAALAALAEGSGGRDGSPLSCAAGVLRALVAEAEEVAEAEGGAADVLALAQHALHTLARENEPTTSDAFE